MGKPLDPGPPLTPADEFCACEPPSTMEYVKAAAIATLAVIGGAGGWFAVALVARRLLAFPSVLIGAVAGWAIHQVAGRHRSVALGAMAAAATVFAATFGYSLLWMPFVHQPAGSWGLSGYDFLMAGVGGFVAYRLAGPRGRSRDSL